MNDFDDFCGNHVINFDSVDQDMTRSIVMMLKKGASYSDVLALKDDAHVIQCASYAFSMNELSREQIATLLELREMQHEFGTVQERPFLDNDIQYTDEARALITNVISPSEQEEFITLLKNKPQSERCYFSFVINPDALSDPRVSGLLNISENLQFIFKNPARIIQRHHFPEATPNDAPDSTDKKNVVIFSVGARDALVKLRYAEHAKLLFPRVGVFSKEDIEQSMRNKGRYSAVSYPGIEGETSSYPQIIIF